MWRVAHGHGICGDIATLTLMTVAVQSPESVSNVLKPVVALYAMKLVETNLGWYMSEGLLSQDLGKAVPDLIRYRSDHICAA